MEEVKITDWLLSLNDCVENIISSYVKVIGRINYDKLSLIVESLLMILYVKRSLYLRL